MAPKQKQIVKVQESTLADFRKAVFQNAKALLFQAEELFEKGNFPISVFLSISSAEEMGKFYLSRVYAIKNSKNELTDDDLNNLTKHTPKQRNSFLPPFAFTNNKIPPNISKFWEMVADDTLMKIRNNCLYVGLKNKKNILTPDKSISRDDALYFLETAFEVILLQAESLLNSLDCSPGWLFLRREVQTLSTKLQELRSNYIT